MYPNNTLSCNKQHSAAIKYTMCCNSYTYCTYTGKGVTKISILKLLLCVIRLFDFTGTSMDEVFLISKLIWTVKALVDVMV